MSIEFPTLVYKGEGTRARPNGTYDYASVGSEEGLEQALAQGWFLTLPEAIAAHDKPVGNAEAKQPAKKPAAAASAASWGK